MVGLLIATHGDLAKTLVSCADLILGKTKNIRFMGLYHGDSIENFKSEIKQNIQEANDGDGVLILTDLIGGSPCNLSVFLMKEFESSDIKIECVIGVNMPILLEAIGAENAMDIKLLANYLVEIGKNSIVDARQFYEL